MKFLSKSVLTFLTYVLRFGRLKASTGAACPNVPNRPNLFRTLPCGCAHTHTRAHAHTRIVKTTNKVGKVRNVRTSRMVIGSQLSLPRGEVGTGSDGWFFVNFGGFGL